MATLDRLSDFERAVLNFEEQGGGRLANRPKAEWVRTIFGISTIRYHQVLYSLLDRPAAEAYAPETVHRLREIVAARERLAG